MTICLPQGGSPSTAPRNWCSTLGIWTLKDLDVALSTRPVDPVIRARKDDCGRCGTKHLKARRIGHVKWVDSGYDADFWVDCGSELRFSISEPSSSSWCSDLWIFGPPLAGWKLLPSLRNAETDLPEPCQKCDSKSKSTTWGRRWVKQETFVVFLRFLINKEPHGSAKKTPKSPEWFKSRFSGPWIWCIVL